MLNTKKLQTPITTSGLLKLFGGALTSSPLKFTVRVGDYSREFVDDAMHSNQLAFERYVSNILGTVPTSAAMLVCAPEGLTFDEVCEFYNDLPQGSAEKKTVTLDDLDEIAESGALLTGLQVLDDDFTRLELRALKSLGFVKEGDYWSIPTVIRADEMKAVADIVVRTVAALKTSRVRKDLKPLAKKELEGLKGFDLVSEMWNASDEHIKNFNFGAAYMALTARARRAKWETVRDSLSEPMTYDELKVKVAEKGVSESELTAVLIKSKGQLILQGGTFKSRV